MLQQQHTDPMRGGMMKVKDLTGEKRRLVEIPYTATLSHTLNALVANRVVAVPVAAPPGQWIGAGGSMILESDKLSGVVRKHYIGMITMLDILAHIAGDVDEDQSSSSAAADDLDQKMSVQVSSVIGHCLESLSLWTLSPNTSILDCMEVFSKGIHRALVPVDGQMEKREDCERIRVLQQIVPGGNKMDTATMLDEAANYLRFLRSQVKALEKTTPTGSFGFSSYNFLP